MVDGFGASNLAGCQVGGFESQCVVFIFGDVFFMRRRFMGHPHGLFGLQQVFGEPFHHLLLQQEFIHDEGGISNKRGKALIMKVELARMTAYGRKQMIDRQS